VNPISEINIADKDDAPERISGNGLVEGTCLLYYSTQLIYMNGSRDYKQVRRGPLFYRGYLTSTWYHTCMYIYGDLEFLLFIHITVAGGECDLEKNNF
jgi:hypothetical protein